MQRFPQCVTVLCLGKSGAYNIHAWWELSCHCVETKHVSVTSMSM